MTKEIKGLKKLLKDATPLEKVVINWLIERAADYGSGVEGVLKDLQQGGCQSGMVSELVYYSDTQAFYQAHIEEINTMLAEAISNIGSSPSDVFGNKWDQEDPLALETNNENLLAWFAFEETAFQIANRIGIEL